jgi:hypothetical protein
MERASLHAVGVLEGHGRGASDAEPLRLPSRLAERSCFTTLRVAATSSGRVPPWLGWTTTPTLLVAPLVSGPSAARSTCSPCAFFTSVVVSRQPVGRLKL